MAASPTQNVKSLADVTMTGAAVPFAGAQARWVLVSAHPDNADNIRVGDENVSATQGYALAPGSGVMFPVLDDPTQFYDTGGIFGFGTASDVMTAVYGS